MHSLGSESPHRECLNCVSPKESVQLEERAQLSMVATLSGVSLIGSVSYSDCDKTHVGVCNSSSGYLCVRIVLLHPSNGASSSRGASQSRVYMACKRSMD